MMILELTVLSQHGDAFMMTVRKVQCMLYSTKIMQLRCFSDVKKQSVRTAMAMMSQLPITSGSQIAYKTRNRTPC